MNPWTFGVVCVIGLTVMSVVKSFVDAKYGKRKDDE